MLLFVAVVLLGTLGTVVFGQNPIPHRPPTGFVYPASDTCKALVEFKAFVDLACPHSKTAWPTFEQVAAYYNNATAALVAFETLIFPLPYHRAAFPAAQATYILTDMKSGVAYDWFHYIFNHQSKYYDGAILNFNQSEVHQMLAEDIYMATGVSKSDILTHFKDTDPSWEEEIVMWKYGCTRTVDGTPSAFINGVRVEFSPTWTLDDWRQVIDPLIYNEDAFYMPKTCPAGEAECKYLPGKMECCLNGEFCIPNVGCRC
ncbi:uncharacterized protein LOC119741761 [Patiria miniata]|uniref:Thioredoxin-like fold domain-containing protein n=1 Tax=Patiria miniata TaxID=46514 RepID=A0A914BC08_PATMI|nr:uncharacterized protein LOC119741761 [Patiria miniata]